MRLSRAFDALKLSDDLALIDIRRFAASCAIKCGREDVGVRAVWTGRKIEDIHGASWRR
jgi:hypothetical protein